jgi:hypothetical protein
MYDQGLRKGFVVKAYSIDMRAEADGRVTDPI